MALADRLQSTPGADLGDPQHGRPPDHHGPRGGGGPVPASRSPVAVQAQDPSQIALALNYLGSSALQLGDLDGTDDLLHSVEVARASGRHDHVVRGYYNLIEGLWRLGRFERASGSTWSWPRPTRATGTCPCTVHAGRPPLRLGAWRATGPTASRRSAPAGREPRRPGDDRPRDDPAPGQAPGSPGASEAPGRRLRSPQSTPSAPRPSSGWSRPVWRSWSTSGSSEPTFRRPWWAAAAGTDRPARYARRGAPSDALPAAAGAALGDHSTARPAVRGRPCRRLGGRGSGVGGHRRSLRTGARAGRVRPCRAPTLEALRSLTGWVRPRLPRRCGVASSTGGLSPSPRSPPRTRENPCGLTDREVQILQLLGDELSNADIAGKLVVSTRTVDHHVSAILRKLDARSRREATARIPSLHLP